MEFESEPEPQPRPEPLSEPDMESLLQEGAEGYDAKRGDIRMGRVIEVNNDGALIDIGLKREGFVPLRDLQQVQSAQMGEVKAGDEVPVLIVSDENPDGYELSIYQARMEEDWLKAEEMLKSRALYEAEVAGYNRGGLTVRFGRIRGFVPLSHIVGLPLGLKDSERRDRLAAMVGQEIGLRVIEVDRARRRLIFSQRQAQRAWQRVRKQRLLDELAPGQRRRGRISSLTDFGAFVDLGGVDGLVHVSEMAWQRVDTPSQLVRVGDEVEVIVLEVDRERERIGLSIKQAQEDPWTRIESKYKVNQLVEGRVTRVADIGAFVEIEPGIEGLLHVSELVGAPNVTPQQVLKPGQVELLKILRIEPSRRRIGLSARRVRQEEWEQWNAEKGRREAEMAPPAEKPEKEPEEAPEGEPGEMPIEALADQPVLPLDEQPSPADGAVSLPDEA